MMDQQPSSPRRQHNRQTSARLSSFGAALGFLKERFARNGAIVRLLNKCPNPPNKDVGEGLNTVQDFKSFVQLSGISLVIWLVIGLAYVAVTHAYSIHRLERLTLSSVLLLTAASVVGGILQLPAVGGGSQLATIGTLRGVFHFSPELSTSCGMMLWLVTFMSVIPAGLILAHREHVSFTRLEKESMVEEKKALDSN